MTNPRPLHEMEKKWQDQWQREGTYVASESSSPPSATRLPAYQPTNLPKYFGLIEFPYPSGEGLHTGHGRPFTGGDVMARFRRMQGKNVLFPIGWDAFGLPTENFAIKHKVKPQDATQKNVAGAKRQLIAQGQSFDWSREINTTDPTYYKWTQWQFLKFYDSWFDETLEKARPISELLIPADVQAQGEDAVRAYRDERRLAYKATSVINWCPKDKIGLANEEAQGGVCERCGTSVEKREKAQWMLRMTKYAERLLRDLEQVDYLERIKAQQIEWIGKSAGAEIEFAIKGDDAKIKVFTTRPDTLFGVTYVVLAPEHSMVTQHASRIINKEEVREYVEKTKKMTEVERTAEGKEKTGVELRGVTAVHPVTGEEIPVWISDYVLANYGTGAVMAVPAHDERDFAFAKKYELPIKQVVHNKTSTEECFIGDGVSINSDFLDGLPTWKAKMDIVNWLEEHGQGNAKVTYKLRDWVFSRQRYWGEPIPIVKCRQCGYVPLPEEQLPLTLPDVAVYEPTDTGESPLSNIRAWVETTCPTCGGPAERETDTMPNWAGSSWYYLRYCDPQNEQALASADKLKYWLPVDLYIGGMEHATRHLLYSRFWHKFLFDLGIIPRECGAEPYRVRRAQGLILAADGEKMSKSKGNVVNPDEVIAEFGADGFRLYILFMGPFDQAVPWDTNGLAGIRRFLDRVWGLYDATRNTQHATSSEIETLYHQTIKKVTEGIENQQFNTCISQLMILSNAYQDAGGVPEDQRAGFLQLLAPFAVHLTEELWQQIGREGSIHRSTWPSYDPSKLQAATFELVLQINGKVRGSLTVSSDISEEEAKNLALASDSARRWLEGKEPKKVVYVKGKLVSIVV